MKKVLTTTVLALAVMSLWGQSSKPEWQNEKIVAVGKQAPRSYFMSFNNRAEAAANDFRKSAFYVSLNKPWKFAYYPDHRKRPVDFYKPEYNVNAWATIDVPATWERNGYGDALYTNHPYEFSPSNPQPPALPEAVPVGQYRTEIDIPLPWLDRDVFLHIGGAKSGMYVYVNGQKVGYSEDSKSAAEFNITPYLTDGRNSLALEIFRWSTGSYLECQDFWRVSGIERDCYIYSQPKTRIEDYYITSTLDSTYTDGIFHLDMAMINNFGLPSGPMQVWYELEDAEGNLVDYSYKEINMEPNARDTMRFDRVLKNVKQWNAESPYLYNLVFKVKKGPNFVEYASQKVGFRTSEIKGNQYLVNGKRVFIKGVNIHEHNEVTGHVVSEQDMIRDFELMKQMNINAVRLSHYPQQRRFYELCDKYGFYVCNETNIESHGMGYNLSKGRTLGNNPDWLEAHMDRTRNMYHQTKNYPSVMFWSLGNEAGNGYNFYETYNWLKSVDQSRPVQYERALLEWNTDIFCPQYPSANEFKNWGEMTTDRPYIASEYAHAMGNSTGNFRDQWQEIYKYKNLQGGFIWDWIDQGFLEKDAQGNEYWTYGGDYGVNSPSDGNFLCNGIVGPDRQPKPAAAEIKKVHQYIHFTALDLAKGQFEVKNLYDFTNTDKYLIKYYIKANNTTVSQGTLNLALSPDQSKTVTVPVANLRPQSSTEYFVNFEATLKADDGLLKKGFVVASDQFQLPIEAKKRAYVTKGTLQVKESTEEIDISSSRFSLSIDRKSGNLVSYHVNGVEMVADGFGLRPNFWRAPTDNDYGSKMPSAAQAWKTSSKKLDAKSVTVEKSDNKVQIIAQYMLPENTALTVTYSVYPSGVVHVGYDFRANADSKSQLPRLGMRMRLPVTMNQVEYFGRGPQENYWDRNWGTNIGLYKSTAEALGYDYVRPQETGHHTDTRWVALYKNRGAGLLVEADGTLEFNALRNSIEDYDAQESDKPYQWLNRTPDEVHDTAKAENVLAKHTHINDIQPRDFVELSLDHRMMGLGGDDSWGSRPYEPYRVKVSQDVKWGFTLIPIRSSTDIAKTVGFSY